METPEGYEGDYYCSSCANELECRCDECLYEDDDDYGDGGARDDGPEYVATSRCCTTQNVHMDLLTEEFVCECKARTLMDNGGVVLLAYALSDADSATSIDHVDGSYPLPAVAVAA